MLLHCPDIKFLGGFLEVQYSPARLNNFEICKENDGTFPGANQVCYKSNKVFLPDGPTNTFRINQLIQVGVGVRGIHILL